MRPVSAPTVPFTIPIWKRRRAFSWITIATGIQIGIDTIRTSGANSRRSAEEFTRRYYTERTHKRIILAKLQLRDEAKTSQRDRRDSRDARTSREASDALWERKP